MLDLSKISKLSSRIYAKAGKLSLRAQFRMLRNMPKLVESILKALEKVDTALDTLEGKVRERKSQAQRSELALLSQIQSQGATIQGLRAETASLRNEIAAIKSKFPEISHEIVSQANTTESKILSQVGLTDQKREFQLALLTCELQNQLGRSGGALLRKSCFTDWWYVLHATEPHETAFLYLKKIKHLPVMLIDIGANTGISALSVHKCAPDWPIFSIEGLSILEPMLKITKQQLDSEGATFDYRICGLGKEDGGIQNMHVAIANGEYVDQMATFTPNQFEKSYIVDHLDLQARGKWDGKVVAIETEAKKFDNLNLELKRPMIFIKMDVEGFEMEVIPGMFEFLRQHKPGILMESDNPAAVAKLLETVGYMPQFYYYSVESDQLVETLAECSESKQKSQGNFFFFAKDSPLFVGN